MSKAPQRRLLQFGRPGHRREGRELATAEQLSGVAAVQTLSRLNRYVPGKTTMVLDFANEADEILAAFKPYFEEATMVATTDPNLIHDIGNKLDVSGLYTPEEVDTVTTVYVKKMGNNALAGALAPVKQRFTTVYAGRGAEDSSGDLYGA